MFNNGQTKTEMGTIVTMSTMNGKKLLYRELCVVIIK